MEKHLWDPNREGAKISKECVMIRKELETKINEAN